MVINARIFKYLNCWADCDKHSETSKDGFITDFGKGYHQAIIDVSDTLFDSRNVCARCCWISNKTKIKAEKCPKCNSKVSVIFKKKLSKPKP